MDNFSEKKKKYSIIKCVIFTNCPYQKNLKKKTDSLLLAAHPTSCDVYNNMCESPARQIRNLNFLFEKRNKKKKLFFVFIILCVRLECVLSKNACK